jgi:exodeoxyribonuclease-3
MTSSSKLLFENSLPNRKRGELRVASWNVNGLRSILKKGFLEWLKAGDFDVVMLQEVKAKPEDLDEAVILLSEAGFHSHQWATADKKGYSGLLTLVRDECGAVKVGLGMQEFDSEGRWLEVNIGNYTIINSYFPNSQRDHARLGFKLKFCQAAMARLNDLRREKRIPILAGDINIAHAEIDLANPKTNKDNAGFLPAERDWMTTFLSSGWTDVFRKYHSEGGNYTWWSYRPGVREKNIGWRLDYFFVAKQHETVLNWMVHQPEVLGSDHCPVAISVLREPNL